MRLRTLISCQDRLGTDKPKENSTKKSAFSIGESMPARKVALPPLDIQAAFLRCESDTRTCPVIAFEPNNIHNEH